MFKRLITLTIIAAGAAFAQEDNWSMGWMAALTTWNTGFNDLQTPGWNMPYHPGGILDLQFNRKGTGIFAEISGDPHRPREATGVFLGLRHDLWHKGRVHVYGQASVGVFEAPSFLEYCDSYEYQNGDCHAGNEEPEYCFWASFNGGFGVRVQLTKKFAIEPARGEYLQPYGIGPRYRFSTGFRFGF